MKSQYKRQHKLIGFHPFNQSNTLREEDDCGPPRRLDYPIKLLEMNKGVKHGSNYHTHDSMKSSVINSFSPNSAET
jgi:hypothetical protein